MRRRHEQQKNYASHHLMLSSVIDEDAFMEALICHGKQRSEVQTFPIG